MAILVVVLTPLLLALGFVYSVTQRAKLQEVLPSLPRVQRSAYPTPWPTHGSTLPHASSYSGYRKAA